MEPIPEPILRKRVRNRFRGIGSGGTGTEKRFRTRFPAPVLVAPFTTQQWLETGVYVRILIHYPEVTDSIYSMLPKVGCATMRQSDVDPGEL